MSETITAYITKKPNGEHVTRVRNTYEGSEKDFEVPTSPSQIRPERESLIYKLGSEPKILQVKE